MGRVFTLRNATARTGPAVDGAASPRDAGRRVDSAGTRRRCPTHGMVAHHAWISAGEGNSPRKFNSISRYFPDIPRDFPVAFPRVLVDMHTKTRGRFCVPERQTQHSAAARAAGARSRRLQKPLVLCVFIRSCRPAGLDCTFSPARSGENSVKHFLHCGNRWRAAQLLSTI